ncbi:mitochondrial ribosomal protein L2 of the large subunit [Venturia nashicola]|uniref:Large ribosomal subunit protein uL2m n=1 Tax=Venturia nashicola TaxID=86259 RepID=A0A4Z1PA00_9PEZI|nr:mitochondrial ribosomal protein L2 of the large subunit [Venturia nashicola]TLD34853.1 mitochondrial ribosomal protein L2 of the large subunit [Venturia nashicola]
MLQPRILARTSRFVLKCPIARLHRGYATVVGEPTPSSIPVLTNAPNPEFGGPSTRQKSSNIILRSYKPRTPGIRHLKRPINDHLYKGKAYRPLTLAKGGHGKGGRNHTGKITVRHHGGGHRRRIRTVDFERQAPGEHIVDRIEYDPNRSAHLALLTETKTGKKSYIIAAEGMRAGDTTTSYRAGIPGALLKSMGGVMDPGMLAAKTAFRGNCLPLHLVPSGTQVYNVGSTKGKGAVFCRSAGTYAVVVGKDDQPGKKSRHVIVKLQSGEVRKVDKDACATIGVASNPHWHFRQLGKAGRSRWLNIRPTVRGLAMNACDHPHGGGRGKSKGNVNPTSPWGIPAKGGYKTRGVRNVNKWVVTERVRNQGKRRSKSA